MVSEAKAAAFKAEAEKALNRTIFFGFGKAQKFEDAAECYVKAANAYKLANLWQSAGECFVKAAECQSESGNSIGHHEIAGKFVEAANCFKKISPVDAIRTFERAIDLYNENGKFGTSARYLKEIAEIFEADNNKESALDYYQQAAGMFENDNKKTTATQCHLKVALLASELGDLLRAAEVFESIGKESMQSNLGKFSAKGYFLQCLLCHLAQGDSVSVTHKLDSCKATDYSFASSRECNFIEQLLKSMEAVNVEDFSQACADFDRITPLDPWKTSMLLKAKKHLVDLAGEGGGGGGDGEVDLS